MEEYFVEEKTKWDRLLDFLVFLAVFVVTIFLILEIVGGADSANINTDQITKYYTSINLVIFVIFFLDLIRLWKQSSGAKDFFRHNWLDVLATIPFGLITGSPTFEILKWTRFAKLTTLAKAQKLSRISKISKEFKAASHLKKEGDEYQRKHRL